MIVIWDCPVRVPGRSSIHVTRLRLTFLEPQALTLLGEATFIAWRLKRPFLRECLWDLRHFWRILGVSGLRPCAQVHLETALCLTCQFREACAKCRWLISWSRLPGKDIGKAQHSRYAAETYPSTDLLLEP